jgi:hypothetical protein
MTNWSDWTIERNGETLLAEDSYTRDSELVDGYPEMTLGVMKKLGWEKDLTPAELATIARVGGANVDAVTWAIDLSGGIQRVCLDHGICHYGNGKARANAWNLPDAIPVDGLYALHRRAMHDRCRRAGVPMQYRARFCHVEHTL